MAEPERLDLPLRGLRVVDTTDRTGLAAARLLADLGAEVIRVERAGGGLDPLTASRNANKRSVVLDAPSVSVPCSATPTSGSIPVAAGSTSARCTRNSRDLVVVSLTPVRLRPARTHDFAVTHPVVYALSGSSKLCRLAGREPLLPPGSAGVRGRHRDGAPIWRSWRLWNRAVNGVGDHVELSMHEATDPDDRHCGRGASVADIVSDAPGQPRAGHPAFPTRDGLVRPLVVSAHQWRALRDWVGNPAAARRRGAGDLRRPASPPRRAGQGVCRVVRRHRRPKRSATRPSGATCRPRP